METSLEIDLASFPSSEPERQYAFIDVLREMISEKRNRLGRDLTMHVETFGCQMNEKDSEKLAGILSQIGYVQT
ncbi:MAG: tRNA (N6-isopentenyl adenosine(37)-C2)-methylthiotransferase MiaB, partial [Lachnospiraceae bacterium]|nr:tRNA (N6-isopentenyl adenosine(37)-C2)-methylthiotransferase MiaB [Lachnospiraceae bacterium]